MTSKNNDLLQIIQSEKPLPEVAGLQSEFISDRENEIKKFKENISSNEFQKISKVCHTWKGFSKPYGFDHLAQLALELELALKAQHKEQVLNVIKNVEHYLVLKKERL